MKYDAPSAEGVEDSETIHDIGVPIIIGIRLRLTMQFSMISNSTGINYVIGEKGHASPRPPHAIELSHLYSPPLSILLLLQNAATACHDACVTLLIPMSGL